VTGLKQPSLPRYTLSDEGDFLRLRWAPGVTMEADDIRSTIAAVTAASPQGKRPLLVHIGPLERITPEAKQLLIDDTCSTRTAVVGEYVNLIGARHDGLNGTHLTIGLCS
jgi:hypothetical protein